MINPKAVLFVAMTSGIGLLTHSDQFRGTVSGFTIGTAVVLLASLSAALRGR